MIDEKSLLHAVCILPHRFIDGSGPEDAYVLLKDVINLIKGQQTINEWIPVELLLPHKTERYEVTVKAHDSDKKSVVHALFLAESKEWVVMEEIHKVIAWRPLGKPYGEDDENETDKFNKWIAALNSGDTSHFEGTEELAVLIWFLQKEYDRRVTVNILEQEKEFCGLAEEGSGEFDRIMIFG